MDETKIPRTVLSLSLLQLRMIPAAGSWGAERIFILTPAALFSPEKIYDLSKMVCCQSTGSSFSVVLSLNQATVYLCGSRRI